MAVEFVANTSGSAEVDGQTYAFHEGITRFSADSPVVKACPLFFDRVGGEAPAVEAATAKPGEVRGATTKAGESRGTGTKTGEIPGYK